MCSIFHINLFYIMFNFIQTQAIEILTFTLSLKNATYTVNHTALTRYLHCGHENLNCAPTITLYARFK